MPSGLCTSISQVRISDTVDTMPTPMNSMAMTIAAISQCTRRKASGN